MNLDKPDPHREHDEYTKLTSLEQISSNDFKDFTTKITKWEASLLKYERIDPEFRIGMHQRRDIVTKSLPSEVKLLVELQTSMD